jgi:thiamine-phosphate pyrophosphorylase
MPNDAPRGALRGLYAITPEMRDTGLLVARVEACIAGGAAAVQYRAKSLPTALRLEQARRLAQVCRSHRVPLIVNDSVELALEVRADGVHLGRDDGDPRDARKCMRDRIVGLSCYDEIGRAREAASLDVDYVGIGSVFPSATKPRAVRAPLSLLSEARRACGRPVVAIGGVTAENAADAIAAGADMVAVISALFDVPDTRAAARSIARLFNEPSPGAEDVRAQPRAV